MGNMVIKISCRSFIVSYTESSVGDFSSFTILVESVNDRFIAFVEEATVVSPVGFGVGSIVFIHQLSCFGLVYIGCLCLYDEYE